MISDVGALSDEEFCYLTTIGRVSGKPREIEIWFATDGEKIYMMAGDRERAHWVRNVMRHPEVAIRIAGKEFAARGRVVSAADEEALVRGLLGRKCVPDKNILPDWVKTALPMAFDLT